MKILKIKFETIILAWNIAQDPVSQKWATSLLASSTMQPDKVQYTNFDEDELTKTYKKLDENIKKFHHMSIIFMDIYNFNIKFFENILVIMYKRIFSF